MAEARGLKSPEVNISRPSSASSPLNCAICLNSLTDKCGTDFCKHEFCFNCLVKWSKIKPECPLCKQVFTTIKHNHKSTGEFEVYVVKQNPEPDNFVDDIRFLESLDTRFYLPTPPPAHEFMFRTTFTVEASRESALNQVLLGHPLNAISITGFQTPRQRIFERGAFNNNYEPPELNNNYRQQFPEPLVLPNNYGSLFLEAYGFNNNLGQQLSQPIPHAPRLGYEHRRRERDARTSSVNFRRSVYTQNIRAVSTPDISGRYRDCSPNFYRQNEAARHRLVPWLNRELAALLPADNTNPGPSAVSSHIIQLLHQYHVCSHEFRRHVRAYFGTRTDQFVHEFYSFMRSPYDMYGYDRNTRYSSNPPSPLPCIELSDAFVSDSGSDVIIIGSDQDHEYTRNNNNTNANNNNVVDVIDLVESDSDEPIIVSEEPAPIAEPTASTSRARTPKLPIKLEMKRKRRCRSRKSMHRRRRRRRCSSSCTCVSSTSTSSSSSSSSSTVGSHQSNSNPSQKKQHTKQSRKRLIHYIEKWRKKLVNNPANRPGPSASTSASSSSTSSNSTSTSTSTSSLSSSNSASSSSSSILSKSNSDTDSDVPLANYAKNQKKRKVGQSRKKVSKRRRSHTITTPESPSRTDSSIRGIHSQPSFPVSYTPPFSPPRVRSLQEWSYVSPSPLNLCTRRDSPSGVLVPMESSWSHNTPQHYSMVPRMKQERERDLASPVSLLVNEGSDTDSDGPYRNEILNTLARYNRRMKQQTDGQLLAGPSNAGNRSTASDSSNSHSRVSEGFLRIVESPETDPRPSRHRLLSNHPNDLWYSVDFSLNNPTLNNNGRN